MILKNRRSKLRKLKQKIAFRIELLYRWTNTEDGSVELVSRNFIILRDTTEEAKTEAEAFLHNCDGLFRNDDGAVIEQVPVKVVSITQRAGLGASWMLKSALACYGYEAGVIRHQGSQFAPELSPDSLLTGTYIHPGAAAAEDLIINGAQIPAPHLENFRAFKDIVASKPARWMAGYTDHILKWIATSERFETDFGEKLSPDDRAFLKEDAPCVLIENMAYLTGLEKAVSFRLEPRRRQNDTLNLREAINNTFDDITAGLQRAGLSASDITASQRKLISDYEDFIARANERLGTDVTF